MGIIGCQVFKGAPTALATGHVDVDVENYSKTCEIETQHEQVGPNQVSL